MLRINWIGHRWEKEAREEFGKRSGGTWVHLEPRLEWAGVGEEWSGLIYFEWRAARICDRLDVGCQSIVNISYKEVGPSTELAGETLVLGGRLEFGLIIWHLRTLIVLWFLPHSTPRKWVCSSFTIKGHWSPWRLVDCTKSHNLYRTWTEF